MIKAGMEKQIIHKAKRQLLQDRVKGINSVLQDNTLRLHRCRSVLVSLVTSTTMDKCTNFINKVRESRYIKVRDRQMNKFNRLMGKDKDRDLSHRAVNLSSTPCSRPI